MSKIVTVLGGALSLIIVFISGFTDFLPSFIAPAVIMMYGLYLLYLMR